MVIIIITLYIIDCGQIKEFTMSVLIWCVIILIVLVAHCWVVIEFYNVAKMKGWSQKKYLIMAACLWLVGYLLIIALPDRAGGEMTAVISDDLPEL